MHDPPGDAGTTPWLIRAVRAGLVLVLWTPLVVTPSTIFPFTVGKAIAAHVVVEVTVLLWVLLLLRDPVYRPPRSPALLALGGYTIITVVTTFTGHEPVHSLWFSYQRMVGVWDLLHWLAFIVVASAMLRTGAEWRRFLNWNLGVALLLALLGISQGLKLPILPGLFSGGRVYSTTGNAGYLAAVLMVTTILAAGLLAQSWLRDLDARDRPEASAGRWSTLQRAFWLVVVVSGVWVLFMAGTRAALAGLLAGVVIMPAALLVFGNREALRPVALASLGVLGLTALVFAADQWAGFSANPGSPKASAGQRLVATATPSQGQGALGTRSGIWAIAWESFLERPVLGWGHSNFFYAFDQNADLDFYQLTSSSMDHAHNQVLEELVTKGAVGGVAYLLLWGTLAWTIVHRRRGRGEEALAYAVLGGLAAYFVQNFFWFDTPATLVQLSVLAAWVLAQGRRQEPAPVSPAPARGSGRRRRQRAEHPAPGARPVLAHPAAYGAVAVALVALTAVSLYAFSYRPYRAAQLFREAIAENAPVRQRISAATRGIDTFPALASFPARLFLTDLGNTWNNLSLEDRELVFAFVNTRGDLLLDLDSKNARLLAAVLPIRQAVAQASGTPEELRPLVVYLERLAPERLATLRRRARQLLIEGSYEEVLRMTESVEQEAPPLADDLAPFREEARRRLGTSAR